MSAVTQVYNRLIIDGDLSVAPITCEDVKGKQLWVYILMGPTGSGKSAYIESLSPYHRLNISKDSLESVTHHVTLYRVLNLSTRYNHDFILVDTPGFLDTKMSERRITTMITETLDSLRQSASGVRPLIFYFQPITDIRMSGSKREAVEMLGTFAQSFHVAGITIITTMWNNITTPKQIEDANRRLLSLKHDIYAGSSKMRIEVAKFEFTKDSALLILDTPYHGWDHVKDKSKNMDPLYDSLMCFNLLSRITNAQRHLANIADDKRVANAPGNRDSYLLEFLLRSEEAVLAALQSFLDDIVDMGPSGLTALESHLDAVYKADPETCSSPWSQVVVVPDLSQVVPEAGDHTLQSQTTDADDSSIVTPTTSRPQSLLFPGSSTLSRFTHFLSFHIKSLASPFVQWYQKK